MSVLESVEDGDIGLLFTVRPVRLVVAMVLAKRVVC